MNKKMVICMLIMTFVLQTVVFGAINFSDIVSGHWAEKDIATMVEKGAILGYSDGTFKPSNEVTKLDSWIMSSRILGANEEENEELVEEAVEEYSEVLEDYITYGTEEIAFLLKKEVIKESELDKYLGEAKEPETREEATIMFTKVLGKEEEVKDNIILSLPFDDFAAISKEALPYVNFAYTEGLIKGINNIEGGTDMQPGSALTRAQMAALLIRVSNKIVEYEEENIPVETIEGTLKEISTDKKEITVKVAKEELAYNVTTETTFRIDGTVSNINGLKLGNNVTLTVKGEKILTVESTTRTLGDAQYGVITSLTLANNKIKIKVPTASDKTAVSYDLDEYVTVYNTEAKETTVEALSTNSYIKYYMLENNKIGKIELIKSDGTVEGILQKVDSDEYNLYLYIIAEDETVEQYPTLSTIAVTRNNKTALVSDLKVGDEVTLTLLYGKIKKVVATGESAEGEGKITNITYGDQMVITILEKEGPKTFTVSNSAVVKIDSTVSTIYDLRVGQVIEYVLDNNTIVTIKANKTAEATEVRGTIQNINLDVVKQLNGLGIIALQLDDGSTTKIFINTKTTLVSNVISGDNDLSANDLKVGQTIVAYGTLQSGEAVATYIVVVG